MGRTLGPQPVARRLVQRVPRSSGGLLEVFPNDIEAAVAEVEWGAASGLKGVLVPLGRSGSESCQPPNRHLAGCYVS